jgi:hypothetical protein
MNHMNTARTSNASVQSPLAVLPPNPFRTPAHFLFLASHWCDAGCGPGCEHKKFHEVARCMTEDGYVYLARAGGKAAEDDDSGVRHLPLDARGLPNFGRLTAAVILDDAELLQRARQQYPEALVYHFETSPAAAFEPDEGQAMSTLAYSKLSAFNP